jgi:hypothetical protein
MGKNAAEFTRLVLSVCFLLILAVPASAQTVANATASWGTPAYGTPVDHYVLQLSTNDGPWITTTTSSNNSVVIELSSADEHRIRVAGVDTQGRQGPYSIPSNSYSPSGDNSGPPGQPGQPMLVETASR